MKRDLEALACAALDWNPPPGKTWSPLEGARCRTWEEFIASDDYEVRDTLTDVWLPDDDADRLERRLADGAEPIIANYLARGFDREAAESRAPDYLDEIRDDLEYVRCFPLDAEEIARVRANLPITVPSHVSIIEDRHTVFPGGDPEKFASEYASRLPVGWRDSIAVLLYDGRPVQVARWTPGRVDFETTKAFVDSENRRPGNYREPNNDDDDDDDDGLRWAAIEDAGYFAHKVPIPPARAPAVSLAGLASRPPETPGVVWPLGVPAIDALLASGGVPIGARVIVQGPTGHGKTVLALESACAFARRGLLVAWVATRDEPPESIHARLGQRAGLPRGECAEVDRLIVIDGRRNDLEDVIDARPDVLVIDSLQKVRTRRGEGASGVQAVAAALEVIEASGVTTIATSQLVRGSGRRARIEASSGGAGVEYGATLLLDLTLRGEALSVAVLKSRHGGEGESVSLRLDRERQRVTSPVEAPSALLGAILGTLADGPRSLRGIIARVHGKRDSVIAAVREAAESGAIALRDGKYEVA